MMRHRSIALLSVLWTSVIPFLHAGTARGAAGDLDPTFGTDGLVLTSFSNGEADASATAVAIQSDGKIVVVGATSEVGGLTGDFAVARYLADGTLDPTFGGGDGRVVTDFELELTGHAGSDDAATAVALQQDGKIVVAGWSSVQGSRDFAVARFDADGSLDPTFGTGGLATVDFGSGDRADQAWGVAVQDDGKIVVAGSADLGEGGSDFAVARFTANGMLDASFDGDGRATIDFGDGPDDAASAVAVLPDGRIVVAGSAGRHLDHDFALARLTADGSLDPSFGTGGRVRTDFAAHFGSAFESNDTARAMALQRDGRIVAAGGTSFDLHPSEFTFTHDFALARYDADGALDASFGTNGLVASLPLGSGHVEEDDAFGVAIQGDGRIVLAGESSNGIFHFVVARYARDGSLDPSFGVVGARFGALELDSRARAVAIQRDGKIVAAGLSDAAGRADFALARFLSGLDTSPCVPDPTTLCLQGGRFEVAAHWEDGKGGSGDAVAEPIVDDSGAFSFFDDANVELLAKVLDGCAINGRVWVFLAGLTDVAVTTTVRDTLTGETHSYPNELGEPFRPVQDTSAFVAACPLTEGTSAAGSSGSRLGAWPREVSLPQTVTAGAGGVPLCAPDATTLCLGKDGRFQIRVSFSTESGASGFGRLHALSSDSGYATFFGDDNVEVVFKVLDGCAINHRVWVFAGGLTNVEVDLTVADTGSDVGRGYPNELGEPFQPIQDTGAFTACP